MSERLPTTVLCCACRRIVPATKARRLITLWARLGRGGSLSGIKDQTAHDKFRCDDCIREGREEQPRPNEQEAML